MELPESAISPVVRASLDDDDLPFDNVVSLVPVERKSVRYDIRLGDAKVRAELERALRATNPAIATTDRPHLIFLDGDAALPEGEESWAVRVISEPDADAFTGPFVFDRTHPLTEGISLPGVIWAGGKGPLPGAPVVMAGNVPLLTDVESASGRHEVRLRLRRDLSRLTESPAWPALIWNLVEWRLSALPGLDRANVRLGEEVTWTPTVAAETVEITRPGMAQLSTPVRGRGVTVRGDRPGVYRLRAGTESVEFAVNPLHRDESDLTKCATGRWGDEPDATTLRLEYRDVTWALVLLATAVGVLHLWLVARSGSTRQNRNGRNR
jgi:hypothetical protein